jgi:hypothetical protein
MKNSLYLGKVLFISLLSQTLMAQGYRWQQVNLQGMGFVTGIVAHPNTAQAPNLVYARTDVAGPYRWDEAQGQWFPLIFPTKANGLGNSIESIALDASNPDNIYLASGNGPGAIYKSTNRGQSWTIINLSNIHMGGNEDWRQGGERLAVDPNNGGRVLFFASRRNGLYRSTDFGATWNPIGNLPVGTDGGQTFVVFDPRSGNASSNSQVLYAGVQGQGVYRSADGGTTWQLLPGGPATTLKPVRGALASNGTLYVTYAVGPYAQDGGAVYKYSGNSLENVTPPVRTNTGFNGISVSPANPDQVVALQWNPGPAQGIHRSVDGGRTWTPLPFNKGGHPNLPGTAANVTEPPFYPWWSSFTNTAQIMIDPNNPQRVWLTTGFGVYRTDNIGAAPAQWSARMKNLEEICVQMLRSLPGQNRLVSGVQDMLGFAHRSLTAIPDQPFYKDVFGITTGLDYCESNPNVVAFVGGASYSTFEPLTGISRDGGTTWAPFPSLFPNAQNGNIAISATDANRWVWAPLSNSSSPKGSGLKVHYTTDGGVTWRASAGAPTDINPLEQFWFGSEALVADRVNGMRFYIYDRGRVYRSTDGGANFSEVSAFRVPWWYKVKMKASPKVEGQLWFVKNDVNSTDKLLMSSDGGTTWNSLASMDRCFDFGFGKPIGASPHPTLFIYGIVQGAEGIYRSTDLGATWVNISGSTPLPLTAINTIEGDKVEEGLVYVGFACRGIQYGQSLNASGTLNGYYKITARHSGKAVDVAEASAANGARVQQYTANGTNAQQWLVGATGDGYYKLTARHSGKALEVGTNATADGALIQQSDYTGGDNQQWKIEPASDGFYKLTAKHSGKVLEVPGLSQADGVQLAQRTNNGGHNQQWRFEFLSLPDPTAIEKPQKGQADGCRVYPNPAQTQVTVEAAGLAIRRVEVADLTGRVRLQTNQIDAGRSVQTLDVSGLGNGWYFIRLHMEAGRQHIRKFVIAR